MSSYQFTPQAVEDLFRRNGRLRPKDEKVGDADLGMTAQKYAWKGRQEIETLSHGEDGAKRLMYEGNWHAR